MKKIIFLILFFGEIVFTQDAPFVLEFEIPTTYEFYSPFLLDIAINPFKVSRYRFQLRTPEKSGYMNKEGVNGYSKWYKGSRLVFYLDKLTEPGEYEFIFSYYDLYGQAHYLKKYFKVVEQINLPMDKELSNFKMNWYSEDYRPANSRLFFYTASFIPRTRRFRNIVFDPEDGLLNFNERKTRYKEVLYSFALQEEFLEFDIVSYLAKKMEVENSAEFLEAIYPFMKTLYDANSEMREMAFLFNAKYVKNTNNYTKMLNTTALKLVTSDE